MKVDFTTKWLILEELKDESYCMAMDRPNEFLNVLFVCDLCNYELSKVTEQSTFLTVVALTVQLQSTRWGWWHMLNIASLKDQGQWEYWYSENSNDYL